MSNTSNKKANKDAKNNEIITMSEAGSFFDRVIGDVSKKSATQQILIGAGSGWATGYVTTKVGKMAAIALGGGIILLQIAHTQGYVKIDWNKVTRKLDKVSDKIEEAATGEKASLVDKVVTLARNNQAFSISFVGGFLIGFGFCF